MKDFECVENSGRLRPRQFARLAIDCRIPLHCHKFRLLSRLAPLPHSQDAQPFHRSSRRRSTAPGVPLTIPEKVALAHVGDIYSLPPPHSRAIPSSTPSRAQPVVGRFFRLQAPIKRCPYTRRASASRSSAKSPACRRRYSRNHWRAVWGRYG